MFLISVTQSMLLIENVFTILIADKLIKFPTWIGPSSKLKRLLLILQKVLDVPHLMVDGDQVIKVYLGTHLYPEVIITRLVQVPEKTKYEFKKTYYNFTKRKHGTLHPSQASLSWGSDGHSLCFLVCLLCHMVCHSTSPCLPGQGMSRKCWTVQIFSL